MTNPSQPTPTHVPHVIAAPTEQVDPETVETAKKLHTLKTRSATFGKNILKPAALGFLGGTAVLLLSKKSKDEEIAGTEGYDTTVTDTNE